MADIIILGAGITGLTAAHELVRAGKDVIVIEEASAPGGKVSSDRVNGYLLEAGPNSLRVDSQLTLDLIDAVGLTPRIIEASPDAKKRFILKDRKWVKVPAGPGEAISTPLFSLTGKLRILAEPFIPRTAASDESAASFITRRLGKEVLHHAADPFITGIYAGDPATLSMRHAFGSMWKAEQKHGSLIRGLMRGPATPTPPGPKFRKRIISFPNGLNELTHAIRAELGDRVRLGSATTEITRTGGEYHVTTESGTFSAAKVVMTVPAYKTGAMLRDLSPKLESALSTIVYPPVAVIYLGFREEQFAQVPTGFGGLIPHSEGLRTLGVIFSSSNFPGRAPDGEVLLTGIVGGARHTEVAGMSEQQVLEMAREEIMSLFPVTGSPVFEQIRSWKRAIPQYHVGYSDVLDALAWAERTNPGLYLAGNYRGGISMGDCIRNATELAKRLV